MTDKEQMYRDIGIVGFVVTELALYLDTHPADRGALEYFNHYVRLKKQLEREFSQKYFPLTLDMAECNNEWRWGAAPLPWEAWEGVCG